MCGSAKGATQKDERLRLLSPACVFVCSVGKLSNEPVGGF